MSWLVCLSISPTVASDGHSDRGISVTRRASPQPPTGRTGLSMALPGSFVSCFAPRSRFALIALSFLAASCAKDPLDFLPVGHLTSAQWATYDTVGAEVAAMSQECRVPLSRHGGAHRSADRPMGGVLVLPPEQRRVSVVEGFRRHLDAAAPLPFPSASFPCLEVAEPRQDLCSSGTSVSSSADPDSYPL